MPCRPKETAPNILLAEDDFEMRRMLVQALSQTGYHVIECASGTELLDYYNQWMHIENSQPIDLIVSDIRMPGITGLELLQSLKPKAEYPPMILITAFGDELTHNEAHLSGAAAIFDKPFDVDLLISKIAAMVPIPGSFV